MSLSVFLFILPLYNSLLFHFSSKIQEPGAFYIYLAKPLSKVHVSITTGQTLTMILRIFLCTLGWSIKMAKNWDTEKLKLSEKFKRRVSL